MRQFKRVFYFLVLNALVSAGVTLLVLNLWNRENPPFAQGLQTVAVFLGNPTSSSAVSQAGTGGAENPSLSPSPLSTQPAPGPTATLSLTTYQVKEGDSLGTIAMAHGVSVSDILAVNDIPDPDTLLIGLVLYIPSGPVILATDTPSATPLPTLTLTSLPSPKPTIGPSPTSEPTQINEPPGMVIEGVIGAGDLNFERVVMRRSGDGELSLAGWTLEDENGHAYLFPQLELYKGSTISLHTRAGADTVTDLYWGLAEAVWETGEQITLRDAQGSERAVYRLP
jgi:LysM repeat protein